MTTPEPSKAAGAAVPGCGGTLGMLLASTAQQVAARFRPAFDAARLKPRHLEVMSVVTRTGQTTQQHLIEALQVDPSVLVGLLNDLEKDGVIQRIRDPRDRRRHLVELSGHGRDVFARVRADVEAAERTAFACLTADERQALRRMLTSMHDAMGRPAETPCD